MSKSRYIVESPRWSAPTLHVIEVERETEKTITPKEGSARLLAGTFSYLPSRVLRSDVLIFETFAEAAQAYLAKLEIRKAAAQASLDTAEADIRSFKSLVQNMSNEEAA